MKERKKTFTALHLQEIHSRCRVVFLRSFISALFLYFFLAPSLPESKFSFRNLYPLASIYMEVYLLSFPDCPCRSDLPLIVGDQIAMGTVSPEFLKSWKSSDLFSIISNSFSSSKYTNYILILPTTQLLSIR